MAEPWTAKPADGGGDNVRPFDHRALEATLADALRSAEAAPPVDNETTSWAPTPNQPPPPNPGTGPAAAPLPSQSSPAAVPAPGKTHPAKPAGGDGGRRADDQSAPLPLDLDVVLPRQNPRRSNPFGPTKLNTESPGEPTVAPPPRPSLLGGGSGPAPNGLGATRSPAGSGLGPTGSPAPGNLTFGATKSPTGLGSDAGARHANALTATPTERPVIPLRRPKPAEPPRLASAPAVEQPAGTAQAASAPPAARTLPPIEAWSPADDDILPRTPAKRTFRLGRR